MTFVQPVTGLFYTEANLASQTGLSPDEDPTSLALNGIYTLVPAPDPYDPTLYESTATYTILGTTAEQGWVGTPLPLPTAKINGEEKAKENANAELNTIVTTSGFSNEVLTAATSQVTPPVIYQVVLDEMTVVTDQLITNLTDIAAAATVDEINNIVNPGTGVIFTGRGAGLGPLDLNVSYYTEFNSVSMTEAETELYVPGTSTVIAYGSGGPGQFDSAGNCFSLGNYLLQIRETSTSRVIAEFECPLNPAGESVAF